MHNITSHLLTAAIASLFFCMPATASDKDQKPHQMLMNLKHEIILLGIKKADPDDFAAAIQKVRSNLRSYTLKGGSSDDFVERDPQGMTPLIAASFEGYAGVVEELLQFPQVMAQINAVDVKGISAWVYASFALKQSLLACNPTLAQSAFTLSPLRITQIYYSTGPETPYQKTKRVLEEAGARANPEFAKKLWNRMCRGQSSEMNEKVSNTSDLQQLVVTEGQRSMTEALNKKR